MRRTQPGGLARCVLTEQGPPLVAAAPRQGPVGSSLGKYQSGASAAMYPVYGVCVVGEEMEGIGQWQI